MNTLNAEHIATHPEEYGFRWNDTTPVKTDGRNGIVLGNAALPVVVDLEKFRATFGEGIVLRGLNGSNSPRVMAQAIARRGYGKDRKLAMDALKIRVVNAMLALRNIPYIAATTVEVTKFVVVLNGERHTFASEAEMDEYITNNL